MKTKNKQSKLSQFHCKRNWDKGKLLSFLGLMYSIDVTYTEIEHIDIIKKEVLYLLKNWKENTDNVSIHVKNIKNEVN